MCEKCGYSGCRHDWQRWTPVAYRRGYKDGIEGREDNAEYPDGLLARGYLSGHIDGAYARQRDPDAAALAAPAWDEELDALPGDGDEGGEA